MTTPPDQPAAGAGQQPPRDRLAIAALALGIAWVVLLGILPLFAILAAILAIIFGIVAIRRANRTPHGRRGMAVAGLVLGVAGLTLTIVLIVVSYNRFVDRCEDRIGHKPSSGELRQCRDDGV